MTISDGNRQCLRAIIISFLIWVVSFLLSFPLLVYYDTTMLYVFKVRFLSLFKTTMILESSFYNEILKYVKNTVPRIYSLKLYGCNNEKLKHNNCVITSVLYFYSNSLVYMLNKKAKIVKL